MTKLDPQKRIRFHESIIKEYNDSSFSQKVAETIRVQETNRKYMQIGIKQKYDRKLLEKNPEGTSYSSELIGMGRVIAYGERDYFIQKLLETCKDINEIYTSKEEAISILKKILTTEDVILISPELKWNIFYSKEGITSADFTKGNNLFLNRAEIIPIPQKALSEKLIIILNKKGIIWNKLIFKNAETKKEETIDITIEDNTQKELTLTFRSVNEIIIPKEKIKKIRISN